MAPAASLTRLRPRLAAALSIFLGAAALMAVSFMVGHPDVFPDTSAYALVGQWFLEQAGLTFDDGFAVMRHREDLSLFFTMAGARSPTYGLLLFVTTIQGSVWAIVALQALAASALIALSLRVVLGVFRLWAFALAIAGLTLATSLPFFVAFVMPDVWLGLGALSALLLVIWFDRLSVLERWALGLCLFATLTFHATNPPDVLVLALVAAGGLVVRAAPPRPGLMGMAIVGLGLAGALVAAAAYPWSVQALAHDELTRPPFLTARVLADGPGRVFLRRACAQRSPYVMCRFVDRPLTDANDILWATNARLGVFEPADLTTRLALVHEERRFVTDVLAAYPLQSVRRLAQDSLRELTYVSVVDTLGYADHTLVARSPRFAPLFGARLGFCVRRPFYCHSTPVQLISEDVLRFTLAGSVLYLVLRLAAAAAGVRLWGHRAPLSPRLALAILAVLALLAANAVLCGSLSGVYPRYQMRITWLAPFMALLAWMESAGAMRRRLSATEAATASPSAKVLEPA